MFFAFLFSFGFPFPQHLVAVGYAWLVQFGQANEVLTQKMLAICCLAGCKPSMRTMGDIMSLGAQNGRNYRIIQGQSRSIVAEQVVSAPKLFISYCYLKWHVQDYDTRAYVRFVFAVVVGGDGAAAAAAAAAAAVVAVVTVVAWTMPDILVALPRKPFARCTFPPVRLAQALKPSDFQWTLSTRSFCPGSGRGAGCCQALAQATR